MAKGDIYVQCVILFNLWNKINWSAITQYKASMKDLNPSPIPYNMKAHVSSHTVDQIKSHKRFNIHFSLATIGIGFVQKSCQYSCETITLLVHPTQGENVYYVLNTTIFHQRLVIKFCHISNECFHQESPPAAKF